MEPFTDLVHLGFTQHCFTHRVWGFTTTTAFYVRPGISGKSILFIAGYLQPATCWSGLIANIWGNSQSKDTLIVVARRGETIGTPRLIGLLPLGWQYAELHSLTRELISLGFLKKSSTLVGHSFGALLGRKLVHNYPHYFRHIVQIAPTPDKRWSLLANGSFWTQGGLRSLPIALVGFLLPWRGTKLPRQALRGLLAGRNTSTTDLERYEDASIRDSAILFMQLLLFYQGWELIKAVRLGWTGRTTLVMCPGDTVTSIETITKLATTYRRAGLATDVISLLPGTAHAFFANSEGVLHNLSVWRKIFLEL